MSTRRSSRSSRYGRYAGGPDPLAPPVDLGEALAAIGDDVMSGASPEAALREYLRRGSADRPGLDELGRRVAQKRRELLKRHSLDGTMQQVKQLLDQAVLAERQQLARELDDDARFAEMRIENLPPSTAAAVSELGDYPWRSSEAREGYEQIKGLLGREALDQRFAGMKQALQGATEADRAAVSAMIDDLNQLMEKRRLGDDTPEDFADFMDKHGDAFGPDGERPGDLDELLDQLARRAAAAQRLRNSLTAEQRAELDGLAAQAFGSPDLMSQLSRMDDNLQALRPGENWSGSERFQGQEGLGLGDGTGALQDLADLDALAEQLAQSHAGADLADVDLDALARQLGQDSAYDARMLAELDRALREAGLITRTADGALRLSPQAMRQLGRTLLKDAVGRLSPRLGSRDSRRAGAAGDFSGSTREWQFGDTEPWDVTRTTLNAVQRTVAEGGDLGDDIRLGISDLEIAETEARTRAAVALLVDTSFSMATEGRWVPMKRTALALHQLVSTRFRGDHLQLIGFGRHARAVTIDELVGLEAVYEQGTNLQHGLMLAERHFRRHPHAQPVLLIVTDGEPTAHLQRDGHAAFDWPPTPETLALTVRELDAVRRLKARTTFFRLGDDPGLARFVERMARRIDGAVVAPDLDGLGAAVVGSYLSGRSGSGFDARRHGWGYDDWRDPGWID